MKNIDRRRFLSSVSAGGLGLSLVGPAVFANETVDLACVTGESPAAATRAAVDAIGGMKRFIKPGNSVFVKPNMSWDRIPTQAATTNPDVVATVVALCKEAGASRVLVTDNTLNDARRCYTRTGIADAAKAAGADVQFINSRRFKVVETGTKSLGNWSVYTDALDYDVLISVPVAKHHSSARLSIGMKNLYGLIGGARNRLHQRMDQGIADLAAFFRPDLTIVDGYRILVRNGPSGGRPSDTKLTKTIIATADPIAADARAAMLFGLKGSDIGYVRLGAEMGLGTMDLQSIKTRDFAI
jgi:uncharacterized protein (DUF362 family)